MKSFENILVVMNELFVARDNLALKKGVALAEQSRGKLTIMSIIDLPDAAILQYQGIVEEEELTEILVKQRQQALSELKQQLDTQVDVTIKITVGKDFLEIVRQVLLDKHDVLIKVANDHPKSFDSSDFHLMRKCPVPVWLLKPEREQQSGKILVAVDLRLQKEQQGREFNHAILGMATTMAALHNSELHLLSCWSLYGEAALRDSGFLKVPTEQLNAMLLEEEQANQKEMAALIADFSVTIQCHLIKGSPREFIPEFCEKNQMDIVVMGTVGRSGIPGLLIGNTAETILGLINSSVVTLKPHGFESPVK